MVALQLQEEWENFVNHHAGLMSGTQISSSLLRPFLFFITCLTTRNRKIHNRDVNCMERCFKILLESVNSVGTPFSKLFMHCIYDSCLKYF